MRLQLVGVLLCAGVCFAQPQYEIGALVGYGVYRDARVNSDVGQATAGIRNRFVAGAIVGEDRFEHFSGEVRYLYQDGDPFLSRNSVTGNIQGQSHALVYDVLIHARSRDNKLRPYAVVGGGGKYYHTTGAAPTHQPVPGIATLEHTSEWRMLFDFGVGVKYRIDRHVIIRADFRDDITTFPKKIFAPVGNATDRGFFHQFTPMAGISYCF